jgi:hypothetical protein
MMFEFNQEKSMSNMTRMMLSAAAALLSSSMVLAASAQAEAPKPKVTDMKSFLCKDVMRMHGEERSVALGVLHGYYLGKKGATQYQDSKLAKATDDFIEYCLDHPSDKALDAFAKFVN